MYVDTDKNKDDLLLLQEILVGSIPNITSYTKINGVARVTVISAIVFFPEIPLCKCTRKNSWHVICG